MLDGADDPVAPEPYFHVAVLAAAAATRAPELLRVEDLTGVQIVPDEVLATLIIAVASDDGHVGVQLFFREWWCSDAMRVIIAGGGQRDADRRSPDSPPVGVVNVGPLPTRIT